MGLCPPQKNPEIFFLFKKDAENSENISVVSTFSNYEYIHIVDDCLEGFRSKFILDQIVPIKSNVLDCSCQSISVRMIDEEMLNLNCFVPYDDSREGNLGDMSIPYEIEFFSPSIREAAKKSKWQCLPEHWQ